MTVSLCEKAVRFRALHDGPGTFVIPNPWDVGSARILAGLGFKALATSSAASASALRRRDHGLNRDEALAHAHLIVDATDLPVSADLGNGFGDAPEVVAETIRFAAEVGLVGSTIEDATGNEDRPLYDFGLAVERIAAQAPSSLKNLADPGVRRLLNHVEQLVAFDAYVKVWAQGLSFANAFSHPHVQPPAHAPLARAWLITAE